MTDFVSIDSFEYFVDGVVCLDQSGVVLSINHAACELLALSAQRIVGKKKFEDLVMVDLKKYDASVLQKEDSHSQIAKLSSANRKEFQARLVSIPKAQTKSEISVIVIKDLSHEEELFQKYQGQVRAKDRKIYESQLLNTILQNIRLIKDPHAMIRQIGFAIMKEVKSEVSLVVTTKSESISCDIITSKENRAIYAELLSAKKISSESFKIGGEIECLPKSDLAAPLSQLWPTDFYCQIGLYEGHESIGLLIAIPNPLAPEELALIKTIRDQTSLSISSSHFEKLSHIDELTNVYNRRYFIQQAQVFFRSCASEGRDCSIVILDLDHFKKINDTDGHLFGDEVLKIVGALLQRSSRVSDIVARYGGEEFILLLPETSAHEATFQAERVRKALEAKEIVKGNSSRFVTASFGIAGRLQSKAETLEQLIDNADQALYQSKETGRNKITIFQPV